ncbi:MAG: hypothetical protein ACYC5O_00700 [Anaerolineae bacterium]
MSAIDTYAYRREEVELEQAQYEADVAEMDSGEYGPVVSREYVVACHARWDAQSAARRAEWQREAARLDARYAEVGRQIAERERAKDAWNARFAKAEVKA